jgi:hypothetical protein
MADGDSAKRVKLRDRYEIAVDEPLPSYDNPPALAYKVRHVRDGERDLIALVCDPKMPTRFDLISALSRVESPYLMNIRDWSIVDWPPEGRRCPVFIFDRPPGGRLMSSLDDTFEPMREEVIVENFVNPAYRVLREIRDQDITHRAIRPTNIYTSGSDQGRVMIGECVSAVPAVAQPFVYETIESCLCMVEGRGVGTLSDDLYSLGVTILAMVTGASPCNGMSDEEVLDAKLSKGSYGALTQQTRISLTVMEALRGLLNDDPLERWTVDDLGLWANGRRGSPIQQSMEARAARSFSFMDKEHYTCRELAHTMSTNWDMAVTILRDGTVDTWLRRALGDDAKVNTMNAAKTIAGEMDTDDNIVARSCVALDPAGPIRFRDFRANPDGFPNVLAVLGESGTTRNEFAQLMHYNLLGFWDECQPRPRVDLVGLFRDLRRAREVMSRTNTGEGIERVIYDLNPHIPCKSPIIEDFYVVEIEQLLPSMEILAGNDTDVRHLIDRHVAAFIATHFTNHRGNELRDLDNQADPHLPTLASVRLLSNVQEKSRRVTPYPKLAALAVSVLSPAIKRFHNRGTRKSITKAMSEAAETGRLMEVLAVVDNVDVLNNDERRFHEAMREYGDATRRLTQLETDKQNRPTIARELGAQVSSFVSGVLTTFAFIGIFAASFLF